jgi:hypothetical protein
MRTNRRRTPPRSALFCSSTQSSHERADQLTLLQAWNSQLEVPYHRWQGPAPLVSRTARRRRAQTSFARLAGRSFNRGWRPKSAVNTARAWVPWLSLSGGHLLVERVWVGLLVLDAVEVLAVELGQGGAVAGVAPDGWPRDTWILGNYVRYPPSSGGGQAPRHRAHCRPARRDAWHLIGAAGCEGSTPEAVRGRSPSYRHCRRG